jgi:hypothetical protein
MRVYGRALDRWLGHGGNDSRNPDEREERLKIRVSFADEYLAGKAAERRALQGSAPGWRRWRMPEELRAIHEAGHAIAQWARGDFVWKLSIMVDRNVRGREVRLLGWVQ